MMTDFIDLFGGDSGGRMIGRGLTSLALLALFLSLDARSLYRKKRWSPYRDSDIRQALEELQAKKRTGFRDFYQDRNQDRDEYRDRYGTPADMDELREILSPEQDDSTAEDISDGISPRDMARLLEQGERLSHDQVTPEPVSDSELEDIFNNESEDEDKRKRKRHDTKRHDTKRHDIKRQDDDDDDDNKEWLLESYLHGDRGVDKKKRQTSDMSSEEGEMTSEDVEFLEAENELLQKENEFLAGALNAATLGQVQGTNKYMDQQYAYLKKAVEAEEALHGLGGEEVGEDMEEKKKKRTRVPESGEEDEEEEEEKRRKKMVPVKKQDAEPDYRQINPLLRKLVDDYSEEELRRRAQEMIQERRKKQDDSEEEETGPVAESAGDEDDSGEGDETDAGEGDEDLVENLETMVASLTPRQRHLMEGEVATLLDSGLLESECPAVESVADGCEDLMRQFSVDLDKQAMNVCNRHKVCYSCGSSVDPQKTLNREACDRIYVEEAKSLCGRDRECHRSAMGLFTLMKKQHGYIDWPSPVTAQLCSQKCVVDFLLSGE